MAYEEKFMKKALALAKKAYEQDEVPVGAVIVKDGVVVASAYNKRESSQDATAHAEILAIKKACKKVKNDRLDNMVLYTTKEPCLMCMGVILSARIKKIVFGAKDKRFGTSHLAQDNNFNHKCECVGGVLENECSNMLTDFFSHLRSKNESIRKIKNSKQG